MVKRMLRANALLTTLIVALVAAAGAFAWPGAALAGDPERYVDRSEWPDWAVTYRDTDGRRDYPGDGELVDAIRYELIRGYPVEPKDPLQYRDREFRAYQEMTRAEFAAVLSRSLALAQDGAGAQWYVPHVQALRERGVIPADAGDDWNAVISRREAGKWMGRAADAFKADDDRDMRRFVDVDDAEIARAIRAGIVKGVGEGRFEPDRPLIRVEAAVMLLRLARAMNSQGNADNPAVIAELERVIREADRWGGEVAKSSAEQGVLFYAENENLITKELAERGWFKARDAQAVKGGKPSGWGFEIPGTFRAQPLEIHDNIATLEYCSRGNIYYIDNPDEPRWTNIQSCGRQFFVKRDGKWLLSAGAALKNESFRRGD